MTPILISDVWARVAMGASAAAAVAPSRTLRRVMVIARSSGETTEIDEGKRLGASGCAQRTARSVFLRSVISIRPGAWVMANGSFAAAMTAWGVTPQAQNTGISSAATGTGSP